MNIASRHFIGISIMLVSHSALASDEPRWALIGDPGNRHTTFEETSRPGFDGAEYGAVDYLYRIAVFELTVAEYFEFVEHYLPIYEKRTGMSTGFTNFTGHSISTSNGHAQFRNGVSPDQPTDMSWEYAARYINWIHHGKVDEEWAYETGVYDTSLFTPNPDGTFNHPLTHAPDARYWIPTADEWVKAAHWDPDLDNGDGGYWQYPTSSNIEPIPSLLPEDGGERNAGPLGDQSWPMGIGSFRKIQSPWGLFDTAGGMEEYTEELCTPGEPQYRMSFGSSYQYSRYGDTFSPDLLGINDFTNVATGSAGSGLRVSTTESRPADLNADGLVNYFDIAIFIRWFIDADERADFRLDRSYTNDDIRVFLGLYANP